METTTWIRANQKRYTLTKVVDVYHDYDGGTWWHIWDSVDKVILFETNHLHEAKEYLDSLPQDLDTDTPTW